MTEIGKLGILHDTTTVLATVLGAQLLEGNKDHQAAAANTNAHLAKLCVLPEKKVR